VREVFNQGGSYEKSLGDHSRVFGTVGAHLWNPRQSSMRTLDTRAFGGRALGPTWRLDSATVGASSVCGLCGATSRSCRPASGTCSGALFAAMATALLLVTTEPRSARPGGAFEIFDGSSALARRRARPGSICPAKSARELLCLLLGDIPATASHCHRAFAASPDAGEAGAVRPGCRAAPGTLAAGQAACAAGALRPSPQSAGRHPIRVRNAGTLTHVESEPRGASPQFGAGRAGRGDASESRPASCFGC
jgi:hypothetical protein